MDFPFALVFTILVVAVIMYIMTQLFYYYPRYPRVDEGFYGDLTKGVGHPDCLRVLPEAAALLDAVRGAKGFGDEGSADYREFELLLSKMACFKQDVMSPNGTPHATLTLAFETAHDRVPVAELTGMCLAHNLPARDVDISMQTWRDRGLALLRRLCTEANLSEADSTANETRFTTIWKDVYEVASTVCVPSVRSQVDKGDASPYEPVMLKERREYEYKYGGLSASGWNSV